MTENEILKFMKNAHGAEIAKTMKDSIEHEETEVREFWNRMTEYIRNSDKDELEAKEEFLKLDKTDLFSLNTKFDKQINNSKKRKI